MRRSSSFKEILLNRILLLLRIKFPKRFIHPCIVHRGIVDTNRFCKIPVHYIIPVKQEILIIAFRNFIWSSTNISREVRTKLSGYIRLKRKQRRQVIKIEISYQSEPRRFGLNHLLEWLHWFHLWCIAIIQCRSRSSHLLAFDQRIVMLHFDKGIVEPKI